MIKLIRQTIAELLEDTRKILRVYSLGALLFFIGLGIIQGANKLLQPSLQQESYVLLGLVVGGCGFVIAIAMQIFLIIQRFKNLGK